MVNICQGQNESNDSFCKRINPVTLTVSLVGGEKMLYSKDISNVVDPTDPTNEEVKIKEQKQSCQSLAHLYPKPVQHYDFALNIRIHSILAPNVPFEVEPSEMIT